MKVNIDQLKQVMSSCDSFYMMVYLYDLFDRMPNILLGTWKR